ncbi:hypothetical protein LP420_04205 [Massilia sp. B-10]|nr:hypothetical protein LP420_04205 [Massilia sp. B-10]
MSLDVALGSKKVRQQFSTRSALDRCAEEANYLTASEWTSAHFSAYAFRAFESSLAAAVNPGTRESDRFGWVASAGAITAMWFADDRVEIEKLRRAHAKHDRRQDQCREAQGKRGALDKAALMEAAMALGWPMKSYGVSKKLSRQFNRTPAYISDILKAEKELRNQRGFIP